MNRFTHAPLAMALLALGCHAAWASTAYGDLNNFDAVNDTGQECHGFEIEIEGVRSTDVTYTYDWNHYGAPRIREDLSDPVRPRVFVRYESAKNPDGSWTAYTAVPAAPLTPTDGHSCTNPSVNDGCEHYGVGYYGMPAAVRYNWLIDDGAGNLVHGPAVQVATPTWSYSPPVAADPALPPDPVLNPIVQPAQAVAAIPAPEVPIPANREFGVPTWVKVVKTTTHNAGVVELAELVSDDVDGDGLADWQNAEPAEVETEWTLLQASTGGDGPKDEAVGLADDMGDGEENVTRRYEFYAYTADASTLDGETGEAMCDEVGPDGIHGLRNAVTVTDPNGDSYVVDCTAQVVVGDYLGAQMAGFDAAAPLGLVDNLQDGNPGTPYIARTVVVGGNTPYTITLTGSLPPGMSLGEHTDPETGATAHGVLAGTPTAAGSYAFSVEVSDADGTSVGKAYTLQIGMAAAQQYQLAVGATGSGSGTISGNGIDCGSACSVLLDAGTTATLAATPAAGSVFRGWSGDCTGTGSCSVTLADADAWVAAEFVQQYPLSVSKTGTGSGSVSGSGIDCGSVCAATLDAGTQVTLNATAAAGSLFTGWSGACAGTAACTTTMNAARAVTASFVPTTQKYSLSVTKTGLGTVASTPKGISCGTKCTASFTVGTTVTLKATAAKKHVFLGWAGACIGNAPTCTVTLNANTSVQARFN